MLEKIVEPLLAAREAMWRGFAKLHRAGLMIVKADQVCRRLMTVPGVGGPWAVCEVQVGGRPFGLTPTWYQSGETDVTGGITRIGDASVRTALHDAANALLTRAHRVSTLKRWVEAVKVPAA